MTNNIGLSVSSNISSMLITYFGITLTNFENLWVLTTLVSVLGLLAIPMVALTPRHLNEPRKRKVNKMGGKLFLILLTIGFIGSVADAMYRLFSIKI